MAAVEIELKLAQDDDAHQLASFARDLIEAGLGWSYQPQRMASMIDDPEIVTLVACERGKPVGFASMRFGDTRAHLVLLAVQPEHQRRGIGRRLVLWLLESARVAGITSIHVELRMSNMPAFAFYRALGFAETIRVHGYYRGRETARRMIRMLAADPARH
jgi:ribosomal protein S18 acetylase RimI-like enzyme